MANHQKPLSTAELSAFLKHHPKWSVARGHLVRTFHFAAFLDGIRFVQQVAGLAEAANHHPDIDVRYSEVTLRLFTHEAKALTAADAQLARECGLIAAALKPVKAAVPQGRQEERANGRKQKAPAARAPRRRPRKR